MARLSTGSIRGHLVRMSVPMVGGIFAITLFNLADTYFVSCLGIKELAAMGFIFPVIMVVISVSLGLGMGASTVISRAIGTHGDRDVRRLTTDSLLISVAVVLILAVLGLLTIDPLFTMLGAGPEVLEHIRSYMTIWFAFTAVLIIPMIGNHCIRATGDTLTPAIIMSSIALLNIALDPIFIFGYFGLPAMGIAGAALATALSRLLGLVASLVVLHKKYHMIEWSMPDRRTLLDSWKRILHIAVPSSVTHLLMPISMGFITRLTAFYGPGPVAAVGAGGRMIHFAYMIPIAMGTSLVPLIGQNWGAGLRHRAFQAWSQCNRFSLYYGLVTLVIFLAFSSHITGVFSDNDSVTIPMIAFMTFVLASSGLQHVGVHSGFTLNAVGRPFTALLLNLFRLLVLMCPLALLGKALFGLLGIFGGMAAAQALTGIIARIYLPRILKPSE